MNVGLNGTCRNTSKGNSTLNQLGHFFSTSNLVYPVVLHCKCNYFVQNWSWSKCNNSSVSSVDTMSWCFSTSASVAAVLIMHPCISHSVWVELNAKDFSHKTQHLRNYIHQHRQIVVFYLVFSTFLYIKCCLNIGHSVTNNGKSWCAHVVLQTL